jgi:hypothetical protein
VSNITLNINTQVSVVLTGAGAAHLNKFNAENGIIGGSNYQAGDVYNDTLWSLMHDFGPAMIMGTFSPLFWNNEVVVTVPSPFQ